MRKSEPTRMDVSALPFGYHEVASKALEQRSGWRPDLFLVLHGDETDNKLWRRVQDYSASNGGYQTLFKAMVDNLRDREIVLTLPWAERYMRGMGDTREAGGWQSVLHDLRPVTRLWRGPTIQGLLIQIAPQRAFWKAWVEGAAQQQSLRKAQ